MLVSSTKMAQVSETASGSSKLELNLSELYYAWRAVVVEIMT